MNEKSRSGEMAAYALLDILRTMFPKDRVWW
jgi:hypothetical protein